MTVSEALARFISQAQSEHLSPTERAVATAAISDCIGCAIAGSATQTGQIVRKVAEGFGGDGRASVIGGSRKLTAQAAALANGTASHALDYDDILWSQYGHPSVVVLPAALALAESIGASGGELITAYAVGVEVIGKFGRFANPAHYEHGWHSTSTMGVIGAAAASAKLLKLSEYQTAMALGIAASQSSGVRRNFGTMTKPFHAGNAASAGVLAAELAREGFTADLRAFEGEVGWAKVLGARSMPDDRQWLDALGQPWELSAPGIVLKRYPACGCTHCALDAILAICAEQKLQPEEIDRIECQASPLAKKVLLYSQPRTGLEGKFSMEFSLAVAAIDGKAGLQQYTDERAMDPRVIEMIKRVSFHSRADLQPGLAADAVPAEVSVHARGRAFIRRVMVPSGDPRNPMTLSERREKFLSCTSGILDEPLSNRLFENLEALDQSPDVATLMAPLREL
jgi:2-methylcitrate dehydratase PrpD